MSFWTRDALYSGLLEQIRGRNWFRPLYLKHLKKQQEYQKEKAMGHNILISIFSGIGTGIISAVIPLILFRKILKDTSLRVEKCVKQYLEQKVSDKEK